MTDEEGDEDIVEEEDDGDIDAEDSAAATEAEDSALMGGEDEDFTAPTVVVIVFVEAADGETAAIG